MPESHAENNITVKFIFDSEWKIYWHHVYTLQLTLANLSDSNPYSGVELNIIAPYMEMLHINTHVDLSITDL